jgi:hypothetical protein
MSNQASDPTPNFSKISLRLSVKAQVRNLRGKCAPLDVALGNQQCPIMPLDPAPIFSKIALGLT